MTEPEDQIPIVQVYRQIGLHNHQSPARLEVVKGSIDRVFAMDDVSELFEHTQFAGNSPESRLFAAAKIQALWETAADERRARPRGLTLDVVRAVVAGLNSATWRCPTHYASDLDRIENAVAREAPLPDC